jgi:hypothetical protein
MVMQLRASPKAWAFWQERPPWYRRNSAHWVMSAKQASTRERRLATLIDCSARGVGIPLLGGKVGGTSTDRIAQATADPKRPRKA